MTKIESIQLDRDDSTSLYIQLYKIIHQYIIEGVLQHGDKLPPIRKLAEQLGVNNVTVVNAYRMLEEHHIVHKIVGSGTFVSMPAAGFTEDHYEYSENETAYIDFASATLSPGLFPVDDYKKIMNEVIDHERGHAFSSNESQGLLKLRREIAVLSQNYHLNTKPHQIQVISGAQQGIDILAKSLLNHGDYVIVEKPTYTGAFLVFQGKGAKISEVPLTADGMNMDVLVEQIEKYHPKLVYVMPDFQNPTGYQYAEEKRRKLLQLAEENDFYIIEDDQLSELQFSGEKVPLLKSMDTGERVIYIKSFSKLLMPGVRLGFLVLPEKICDRVLKAKQFTDIATSGFAQRVFAQYLQQGHWQKQIERVRMLCKDRYNKMIYALKTYMPDDVTYTTPIGGLHVWVCLPEGYSVQELFNMASQRQLTFIPGHVFFPTDHMDQFFRLSFADVSEKNIDKGIKLLADMIKNEMQPRSDGVEARHSYMSLL